jgi:ABC-type multidrug transport system fused ATPase/permease subunit
MVPRGQKISQKQPMTSGIIEDTIRASTPCSKRLFGQIFVKVVFNIGGYLGIIVFGLFGVSLEIFSILVFREYINTFEPDYEPIVHPNYLGLIFLGIKLVTMFNSRQMDFKQNYLGTKSSIELSCFIYDKILKASPASLKPKSGEGEIINFLQVDAVKIATTLASSPTLFTVPIQIIAYTVMIFVYFGISYLFGIITLALCFAVNLWITIDYSKISEDLLTAKDERMKITAEVFNSLKLFKLYGWENEFKKRIENARNEEIKQMKRYFNNTNLMCCIYWATPMLVSVVTIFAYQYFSTEMNVSNILTFVTIFGYVQNSIYELPWNISMFVNTLVSLKRIEHFLDQTDIDKSRLLRNDYESMLNNSAIVIKNGNFTWGNTRVLSENDSFDTKSSSSSGDVEIAPRVVLKNINLTFKKGELVMIIGEVGSGKSSLLQAILNNMLVPNENPYNPTKLIINGSVSYVSQSSWILNDTVKSNILFTKPYDENKYHKVIDLCELKQDLDMLVGGDMTEIGEKGINVSGGQKARISIARAVYSDADIIMLDDSISALDAHVGQNIMTNCINGYLKGKTRIMITHALQYLSYADRVIFMNDGEVFWIGKYEQLIKQSFYNELTVKIKATEHKDEEPVKKDEFYESDEMEDDEDKENEAYSLNKTTLPMTRSSKKKVSKKSSKTNLVQLKEKNIARITKDEQQDIGHVKLGIYKEYLGYLGGWKVNLLIIFLMLLWQATSMTSEVYLTYWSKYGLREDNMTHFWRYSSIYLSSVVFICCTIILLSWGSIKCSEKLHTKMINSLMRAPINLFHDTIPKGQIYNRLSKDLNELDTEMMFHCNEFYVDLFTIIGIVTICSIIEPFCLINIPILFLGGMMILKFYLSGRRDLTRIEGIIRSPLLNLITETLPGTITIRAYEMQDIFMKKFYNRINDYFKVHIFTVGVSNWFSLHLDFLYFIFSMFLVVFSILFREKFDSQTIGLMLSYSLLLQIYLFSLLNTVTLIENNMVCMERCLKFTDIPAEKPNELPSDKNLNKWPSSGRIKFANYSVKYRPETEIILKNLNITINSKEKVGIVGRTGSGKSTLCLCLFRILEPTLGTIYIDDIDITTVGLIKLRSSLTIIPQDPSLVEGSLRYNIDPLSNYKDEEIINVLERIGFSYIIKDEGLDQLVSRMF